MEVAADSQPARAERGHPAAEVVDDILPSLGVGAQLGVSAAVRGDQARAAILDHDVSRLRAAPLDPQPRATPADVEHRRIEAVDEAVVREGGFGLGALHLLVTATR